MKVVLLAVLFSLTIYGMMSLTSASSGNVGETEQDRFIGGKKAKEGQFKPAAYLRHTFETKPGTNEVVSCGATLISTRRLLTAVRCVEPLTGKIEVILGATNLDNLIWEGRLALEVPVENIEIPGGYDIALLKLHASITLTDYIHTAGLPNIDNNFLHRHDLTHVTTVGWGGSPKRLRYSKVRAITNAEAQRALTKMMKKKKVLDQMISEFPNGHQMTKEKFKAVVRLVVQQYLTENKFMITYDKKGGPCVPDFGSGIFYYKKNQRGERRPYLVGIVSGEIGACEQGEPSLVISTMLVPFCKKYPWFCK